MDPWKETLRISAKPMALHKRNRSSHIDKAMAYKSLLPARREMICAELLSQGPADWMAPRLGVVCVCAECLPQLVGRNENKHAAADRLCDPVVPAPPFGGSGPIASQNVNGKIIELIRLLPLGNRHDTWTCSFITSFWGKVQHLRETNSIARTLHSETYPQYCWTS